MSLSNGHLARNGSVPSEVTEVEQRVQSIEPLLALTERLANQIGKNPKDRVTWLLEQTSESFSQFLVDINQVVRCLESKDHWFDGENVRIRMSFQPDQEDKLTLLEQLIDRAQEYTLQQIRAQKEEQLIMTDLAASIPSAVVYLHLFINGNGRTTRILRYLLRDSDQTSDEKLMNIVQKKTIAIHDTTLHASVERSVLKYLNAKYGHENYKIVDDIDDEDGDWPITFCPEIGGSSRIRKLFPTLNRSVERAYFDDTFHATVISFIEHSKCKSNNISITNIFTELVNDPESLKEFLAINKKIRKEYASILVDGLLDLVSIPLYFPSEDRTKSIENWINHDRRRLNLQPVDPSSINTIHDLQRAYCETFSPPRR